MRLILFLIALCTYTTLSAEERNYGSLLVRENSPDTLYIIDEIKSGDSFELRKALRNHTVSNVILASPGGSVFEALQMAGIIHDNQLRTYIPRGSECASACAFLFFAGTERLADGRLGVHQAYSKNSNLQQNVGETQYLTQFTVSEIIGFLNEFGTPPFVYERMFEGLEMYYFEPLELMELNSETFSLDNGTLKSITRFTLSKSKDRDLKVDVKETGNTAASVDETQILKSIQTRLNSIGCNAGVPDGIWGRKTEAAIKRFSKLAGLPFKSDTPISPEFIVKLEAAPKNYCPKIAVKQSPKRTTATIKHATDTDLSGKWKLIAYCSNDLGTIRGNATLSLSSTKNDFVIYNVQYKNDRHQFAEGHMYHYPEPNKVRIVIHFGWGYSINAMLNYENGVYRGFDSNSCKIEGRRQ